MNATPPRATVLIVEDDFDILGLLRDAFEQAGYRVNTAVNGFSAMLVTAHDKPDVILLDLGLPEMDGEEFCGELRREFGDRTPIVMVSASAQLQATCERLGVAHWVSKPFDMDALIARVEIARSTPVAA